MKKSFLMLVVFLSISSLSLFAQKGQTYNDALGLRFWDGGGISYKHFMSGKTALEFNGFFWNQGTRITGLYEVYDNIGSSALRWYYGGGAHIGMYNAKHGNGNFIGLDGVLGFDYKFAGAPINISLDWQPSFEFGENRGLYGGWGGLGVRYTF